MNPEKQRIAIATACGWTEISMRCMWGLPPFAIDCGTEECLRHLPDYLNDLNACHAMEQVLTEKGVNIWWIYAGHLLRGKQTPFGSETAIHATAPQRSEAFLRTLGLWEDAQ